MAAEPPAGPGAIIPTDFLNAAPLTAGSAAPTGQIQLEGEPLGLAISGNTAAVLLVDGRLTIIDLPTFAAGRTLPVGPNPQAIAPGFAGSGQVFVSANGMLHQIDVRSGQTAAVLPIAGRLTALTSDSTGARLFAVDAENNRLLVFAGNPLQLTASRQLDEQPGQVTFNLAANQIIVGFPGAGQLAAFDADTLAATARAAVTGGPLLSIAANERPGQIVALNALAPGWRGLTVFDTALRRQALIAGAPDIPLKTAATLAIAPDGGLLLPETTGLLHIELGTFITRRLLSLPTLTPGGGLTVAPAGNILLLDSAKNRLLRVTP
jgi:hypothetical protein